jgi:hypothetical protein
MSPCQGEGRRFKSAPPLTFAPAYLRALTNLTENAFLWHPDVMERRLPMRDEDIGFWKNLFLIAVFFVITPLTIGISLFSLFSLQKNDIAQKIFNTTNLIVSPKSGVSVYASLPGSTPSISSSIESADARPQIVKNYLSAYDSPLTPYASFIVQEADKYSLDFRLTTAIAQQESNLCKVIPAETYNCWGWGIHSKGTLGFNSFQEGIDEVSKGLRENYLDEGLSTIEEIMSKYTPLSNGSWAQGVNKFMSEME